MPYETLAGNFELVRTPTVFLFSSIWLYFSRMLPVSHSPKNIINIPIGKVVSSTRN
jgi:hypothetical protein